MYWNLLSFLVCFAICWLKGFIIILRFFRNVTATVSTAYNLTNSTFSTTKTKQDSNLCQIQYCIKFHCLFGTENFVFMYQTVQIVWYLQKILKVSIPTKANAIF